MKRLDVHLILASGEPVICGELVIADPDDAGRLHSQFRYSHNYLNHPDAFPIDPINLPLREGIVDSNDPRSGLLGVFTDALPDAWGRKVMSKNPVIIQYRQERGLGLRLRDPDMLEWLGDGGLGALRFSPHEKEPRQSEVAHWTDLGRLQQAAMAMESHEVDLATISKSFWDAGTPSGGARPKVLLPNYLVKFPSGKDDFHVLESEHTVMELAAKAGLHTAKTQLHKNHGSNLLSVERFDCLPTGGRAHMISMETLMGVTGFQHLVSYPDLARMIRQVSVSPEEDVRMLFLQMLCNLVFGNTDDHLKNFTMIHDGTGYRLSPAYDLVAYRGSEHAILFDRDAYPPDHRSIMALAGTFKLSKQEARQTIEQVAEVASEGRDILRNLDVPEPEHQAFDNYIQARLAAFRTTPS